MDQSSQLKTAAVFDLDGTICSGDTYLAFLLMVLRRRPGRWIRSVSLPFAAGLYWLNLRDNTWLKKFFLKSILQGMTLSDLEGIVEDFVQSVLLKRLRPLARERIQYHKDAGHLLVLATASPDIYVESLARHLGMDVAVCTMTERVVSCFSGRLSGPNCKGLEKVHRLNSFFGADRNAWHIIAYSDHHSDLPLLKWADTAIAVTPNKSLRKMLREFPNSLEHW